MSLILLEKLRVTSWDHRAERAAMARRRNPKPGALWKLTAVASMKHRSILALNMVCSTLICRLQEIEPTRKGAEEERCMLWLMTE
jgi:hypothetical protein